MALETGQKLGPYEILGELGAGGMGEVYRARDTRLDRTVAIKVLPEHLSADPNMRQRFEREARAVSGLNHPNICTLHDIGCEDGVDFLVMEHLEGETLGEHLERGPLPQDEALRHGAAIADALDKAHRQGVVHRDLKPGNIMLTPSGAKLLDFGLAKSSLTVGGDTSHTATPTMTSPLTAAGTILGTSRYMSPEQLAGKEADSRSDIFALGVVLFEMMAGRRPFQSDSHAGLIAAIMERQAPSVSSAVQAVPPALDHIVRRCLEKDPEERWQTAGDLARELRWAAEAGPEEMAARAGRGAGIGRPGASRLWMGISAVLLLAVAALILALALRPAAAPRPVRAEVPAPPGTALGFIGALGAPVEVSPDGRHLVFGAVGEEGDVELWLRSLDDTTPRRLSGTRAARRPFWSADSRNVGFFADARLKRIDIAGGPALTICDAPDGRGGTWNQDGVIVFSGEQSGGLKRVMAGGGEPVSITQLDKEANEDTHRYPFFLPDGRHFLYLARSLASGTLSTEIRVAALDSDEEKTLLKGTSHASFAAGHLLFLRDSTLMAQPFDTGSLELTGDPLPVAEGVVLDTFISHGTFSASDDVMAYVSGGERNETQLVWLDRSGRELGVLGEPAIHLIPTISPDGRRVGVSVQETASGNAEIWLYEVDRSVRSRFTFEDGVALYPQWSPDGSRIAFSALRENSFDVFLMPAGGTGTPERIFSSERHDFVSGWTPDGRYLLLTRQPPQGEPASSIWLLPVDEGGEATPYLEATYRVGGTALSPDGKWLAYGSSESGRTEVYVATFPELTRKWQVSGSGGDVPVWSPDGRELFFLGGDQKMRAVSFATNGDRFQVEDVEVLFEVPNISSIGGQFVVAPDGRFLVNRGTSSEASRITVAVHWAEQLSR